MTYTNQRNEALISTSTGSSKTPAAVQNSTITQSMVFQIELAKTSALNIKFSSLATKTLNLTATYFADQFVNLFLRISRATLNNGTNVTIGIDSQLSSLILTKFQYLFVDPSWTVISTLLSERMTQNLSLSSGSGVKLSDLGSYVESFDLFGAKSLNELPQSLNQLKNFFWYELNFNIITSSGITERHFLRFELKYTEQGILDHYSSLQTIEYNNSGEQTHIENLETITFNRTDTQNHILTILSTENLLLVGLSLLNLIILMVIVRIWRRKGRIVDLDPYQS